MQFNGNKCVEAVQFVKRLRGMSQAILVQGSDGMFYVVKFPDNLECPNVAFNESMGSAVFNSCGVPVPGWEPVRISGEFLDRNPGSWLVTPEGARRPGEGWGYGSRFLGLPGTPLREILPGSSFGRISNRLDFWKTWVLDVLCEHADNRQALFLREENGLLNAIFIDHGHLFGGPRGMLNPSFRASQYLDPRIYFPVTAEECGEIMATLKRIDPGELMRTFRTLPDRWITPTATVRFERFLDRLADQPLLKQIAFSVLDGMSGTRVELDRGRAKPVVRDAMVVWRNQIQVPVDPRRRDRWSDDLACGRPA